MARWLVRRTWDLMVESSSSGRRAYVVLLGEKCLSAPRCINENQEIALEILGGNLQWTSMPSSGSRDTPRHFIPQKPEISADTDELSNYDWGRRDLNVRF